MAQVYLDPVPRIEGHMGCEVTVADTSITGSVSDRTVSNVKISGTTYRGFENILYKRPVQDAILITQRI